MEGPGFRPGHRRPCLSSTARRTAATRQAQSRHPLVRVVPSTPWDVRTRRSPMAGQFPFRGQPRRSPAVARGERRVTVARGAWHAQSRRSSRAVLRCCRPQAAAVSLECDAHPPNDAVCLSRRPESTTPSRLLVPPTGQTNIHVNAVGGNHQHQVRSSRGGCAADRSRALCDGVAQCPRRSGVVRFGRTRHASSRPW